MREPSYDITRDLKAFDSRIGIVWDSEFHGWRFTYNGEPQASIIEHVDGTELQNLYSSELIEILNRSDMTRHFDALEKARERGRQLAYERRRAAERYVEQDVRPAMRKDAEFIVDRNRTAKPFVEVNHKPIPQKVSV